MKTVMVFGAGMTGRAIARLLGAEYEFIGFIDNKKEDAFKPNEAVRMNPDCIILGVMDSDRPLEMWAQLMGLGYKGDIIRANALNIFDPRYAVMRLAAERAPEGDIAELGVYRGNFAYAISKAFPGRTIHLFDTFSGFDPADREKDEKFRTSASREEDEDFTDTSAEGVKRRIPGAVIHEGHFPETFSGCEDLSFAFVSIDADLYEPTKAGLELFYPRLKSGGVIMVHDYISTQFPGVRKAVDEFCDSVSAVPLPVADLHGSVVIYK